MNTVFDVQDTAKQVVIVCDKDREKFAESLISLISSESGIKAGMMRQNEYEGSRSAVSSENYFIFLGNYPEIKGVMKQQNLKDESAKYGIFIGKIGRRALIQVDLNAKDVLNNKIKYENYIKETKESWQNAIIAAALIPLVGVLAPIGWSVLYLIRRRQLKKQLYACAIFEYYEKYIKSFLSVENDG